MTGYVAMQVSAPGVLERVERPLPEPGRGEVRIRVEACGVCGADAGAIEGTSPNLQFPRVPGHEVAGRVDAVGEGVTGWQVGQRVGVGRLGGHCGECPECREGEFVHCRNQPVVGLTQDGGYAQAMLARSTGLVSLPDEITAVEAAPLLCAGLTTFNALRNSGARAGDLVAVHGAGGLGHLAVQFARKMGFRVVAVARGDSTREAILALGAHRFIDSEREDAAKALKALGGAKAIVSTVTHGPAVAAMLPGLGIRGRMIVAGTGKEPIAVPPALLVNGRRSIEGTLTGTPAESEQALRFCVAENVRPRIEVLPLERAWEAYQRMARREARFRMVLAVDAYQ